MTPLRKKMIDEMTVRGLSPRTHQAYLSAVTGLARHYRRSPDQVDVAEIQAYLLHCLEVRQLSYSTCQQILNGLRFFYLKTLKRSPGHLDIPRPKSPQRLPEVLNTHELQQLFNACPNPKHRAILQTTYAAGLRVSEVAQLQVGHLDAARGTLRVQQGKGRKDRYSVLSPSLVQQLQPYLQIYCPRIWLFPSSFDPQAHLSVSSIQKVFVRAKREAGITKHGGIHTLRHAFATHQLEAGMPVHRLQQLLGHRSLSTTMRYVHLVALPNHLIEGAADLLQQAA